MKKIAIPGVIVIVLLVGFAVGQIANLTPPLFPPNFIINPVFPPVNDLNPQIQGFCPLTDTMSLREVNIYDTGIVNQLSGEVYINVSYKISNGQGCEISKGNGNSGIVYTYNAFQNANPIDALGNIISNEVADNMTNDATINPPVGNIDVNFSR